jgi:hypothetical protein
MSMRTSPARWARQHGSPGFLELRPELSRLEALDLCGFEHCGESGIRGIGQCELEHLPQAVEWIRGLRRCLSYLDQLTKTLGGQRLAQRLNSGEVAVDRLNPDASSLSQRVHLNGSRVARQLPTRGCEHQLPVAGRVSAQRRISQARSLLHAHNGRGDGPPRPDDTT